MAHPQTAEAVDVPSADPTDRFRNLVVEEPAQEELQEEELPAEPAEEELPEELLEEEQIEGDELEEEVEPETAIDVPASLNAEEKEAFEQLPSEAQQYVADLEARRNADVTRVTTKAANAQRDAEALAANASAQAKVDAVREMEEFTALFQPKAPDPMLAQTNMQQYILEDAQFKHESAQFEQIKQHLNGKRSEVEAAAQAEFVKARDEQLMRIPEVANPETREAYLDAAFEETLLTDLEYNRGELTSIADAQDVVRLRKISEWRDKAAKFDALNKTKMRRVRSAKKTNRPGTAQVSSSKGKAVQDARTRLRQSGKSRDAEAAFKALLT